MTPATGNGLPWLRKKGVVAVLAATLWAGFIISGLQIWKSERAFDFFQWWTIGRAVRDLKLDDIYSDESQAAIRHYIAEGATADRSEHQKAAAQRRVKIFEPAATPFLYSVFLLVFGDNYDSSYEAFRIATFFLFIAGFSLYAHAARLHPLFTLSLFPFFTFFFSPFRLEVQFGNLNGVQLALTGLSLFLFNRREPWLISLGGFIYGLAVLVKPNIVLSVLVLLSTWVLLGRTRKAAFTALGLLASGIFALMLSAKVLGAASNWLEWYQFLTTKIFSNARYYHSSFVASFFRTRSPNPEMFLAIPVYGLLAVSLVAARLSSGVRCSGGDRIELLRDVAAVAVGFLAPLLTAPLVHIHYFMLMIPAFFLAFRPLDPGLFRSRVFPRNAVGIIAALAVAISTIGRESATAKPFGAAFILFFLTLSELFVLIRTSLPGSGNDSGPVAVA